MKYKTPCYIIHKEQFQNNLLDIKNHFERYWKSEVICSYSCKTNNSREMIRLAKEYGMYAEVVSSNEYNLAKEVGFEDSEIIYNGPCKGEAVYSACYLGAIINIDNLEELNCFSKQFYKKYGKYPSKLGLRCNFDLEAVVPGETSTELEPGRFGICYENGDFEKAINYLNSREIRLEGLHIHFTTKTRSLSVYEEISKMFKKLINEYGLNLSYIDIGGGFWGGRKIDDKPTMEEYSRAISSVLNLNPLPKLILEPGSALCSTVVEYLTKVISVKDIRNSRFIILDGTSLHINPFQYKRNAQYVVEGFKENFSKVQEKKHVLCGATCLEKDIFAYMSEPQNLKEGDYVRFLNVGAYTMSFVSEFILEKPVIYLED